MSDIEFGSLAIDAQRRRSGPTEGMSRECSRTGQPVTPSRRVPELDALRGLASVAVGFAHYHVGSRLVDTLGVYGQHGVELFFVISGLVIYMTLQRSRNLVDFIASRTIRLYPPYLATCAVIAALQIGFSDAFVTHHTTSTYVGNVMIWHPLFQVPSISVVFWTLWVEIKFYIIIALILLLRRDEKIDSTLWLWLAFVWGYEVVTAALGVAGRVPGVGFLYALAIPEQAHLFIAGIVFYKFLRRDHVPQLFALLVACMLREFALFSPDKTWSVMCIFLIFALLVCDRLSFLDTPPLLFLGKISYSLYLVHETLGHVVIYYLSAVQTSPWLQFCCAQFISIVVATALTYGIEQPTMAFLRRTYKRVREKAGRDHVRDHVPAQ